MNEMKVLHDFVGAVGYSALGIIIFALAFVAIVKLMPFPVLKEIEHDQNVALAIMIGSVFVGIAIIIAAAIT